MKILDLIFNNQQSNHMMPVIFSIDMVIEGESDNHPQNDTERFQERFQEHFLYSFSVEAKYMRWWERSSFINHIDYIIENQALAFFNESWQSCYTIAEEKTDDGIQHVIFLFPQPELHETPYTKTQAHIVSGWLRQALQNAQKEGQINTIFDEKLYQDYATPKMALTGY